MSWLWAIIIKYCIKYVVTGKSWYDSAISFLGSVKDTATWKWVMGWLSFARVSYSSNTYSILTKVFSFFSSVHWEGIQALINGGLYYKLQEGDHDKLRAMLKPNYYFILTRRKCHLTTYLISLASLVATGKMSHYTHALMNVDDGNIKDDNDFKLIEATEIGVHFSTFMQVFDCDSVALLKPKGVTDKDWVTIIDRALADVGKPYDNLFDVLDHSHLSCIELVRDAASFLPTYEQRFANFEKMIKDNGNKLTPQMLYDCPDFEVIFEVRR